MMPRCLPWNRILFVEGIGRVHAIGLLGGKGISCAVLDDHPNEFEAASRAADIVNGDRPGRILWAVRLPPEFRWP